MSQRPKRTHQPVSYRDFPKLPGSKRSRKTSASQPAITPALHGMNDSNGSDLGLPTISVGDLPILPTICVGGLPIELHPNYQEVHHGLDLHSHVTHVPLLTHHSDFPDHDHTSLPSRANVQLVEDDPIHQESFVDLNLERSIQPIDVSESCAHLIPDNIQLTEEHLSVERTPGSGQPVDESSFLQPESQTINVLMARVQPNYEIQEPEIDPVLGISLPTRVLQSNILFVSRSASLWSVLASTVGKEYICRFCGHKLSHSEPGLSIISHILGQRYYRKKRTICASQTGPISRCQLTHFKAIERARQDLHNLVNPKSPLSEVKLHLPSLQQSEGIPSSSGSALSQSTISWVSKQTLLTKAMLLVSQKFLPFSLFDSVEFNDFLNTAIELSNARKYEPIRADHLKSHISSVYQEVKTELATNLRSNRHGFHLSIDGCTFNSTKNIYNVLVSDEVAEWHIGHAYMPKFEAKNATSMHSIFLTAIQMIQTCCSSNSQTSLSGSVMNLQSGSSPILQSASSSTQQTPASMSSVWGQISTIPSMAHSTSTVDSFFTHKIATITVDGAAVNKSALSLLSSSYPEIIGLICSAHGLNLAMKHIVAASPWMGNTLEQSSKIIKFFKNKSRPREILRLGHPKQLTLPPKTRFCYSLISLQSLSAAKLPLKSIALASMTEGSSRTQIQTEWMRLFNDLKADEKRKFQAVEKLLQDPSLYERLESMIKVLLPIFLTLRVFDRSSPGACGWLLCSLFHLRKVLKSRIDIEFGKLEVLGRAETIKMLDERLKYLATPAVILSFF